MQFQPQGLFADYTWDAKEMRDIADKLDELNNTEAP
jgi:hypothetical protein